MRVSAPKSADVPRTHTPRRGSLEATRLMRLVTRDTAALTALFVMLAAATGRPGSAIGAAVGGLVSLLNFWHLVLSVDRALEMPKRKAIASSRRSHLRRLATAALALVGGSRYGPEGFFATLAGLMAPKLAIFARVLSQYPRIF